MASMPDVISLHNSATVTHNVVPRFVLWGRGVTFDYRQESASNKRAGGWFFRSVMGKNSHVCLFFYADENTLEKKIYIIIIIMKGRKWDREKKRPSRVDETLIFGKYNEKKRERERWKMKRDCEMWKEWMNAPYSTSIKISKGKNENVMGRCHVASFKSKITVQWYFAPVTVFKTLW